MSKPNRAKGSRRDRKNRMMVRVVSIILCVLLAGSAIVGVLWTVFN